MTKTSTKKGGPRSNSRSRPARDLLAQDTAQVCRNLSTDGAADADPVSTSMVRLGSTRSPIGSIEDETIEAEISALTIKAKMRTTIRNKRSPTMRAIRRPWRKRPSFLSIRRRAT